MNMRNPVIDEWQNIHMEMRPKVRWWLPAACVDDEDIVRELEDLYARGFGGVEVCCRMILPNILRSDEGWGRPHWEHVIDVIDETACRLGMTMDLTNGPNWPISMRSIESADDEAAGYELTYGKLQLPDDGKYDGPLPERVKQHDEGTPHLIAVIAYMTADKPADYKDTVYSDTMVATAKTWGHISDESDIHGKTLFLNKESYRNLMDQVYIKAPSDDDTEEAAADRGKYSEYVSLDLGPAAMGQHWILFAFYEQPSAEKINGGEYVIDHKGKAGAKACADYWEPQMAAHNSYKGMESIFCDSMEYHSDMEWSHGFLQEFEKRRGYSIIPYLPVIGSGQLVPEPQTIPDCCFSDFWVSDAVNNDYMETLTDCYCENHLGLLEEMAEKYGKTIRYQVAYNKPFEIERSALYVGVPENEALGRCAIDSQKAMASAAHLGRKKRYSFECAAEYANAYGQSYEDLFWWVKRSLMAGMNAQVLHGASYSGAYHGQFSGMMSTPGNVPMSAWPGFEAFRKCVSNYWNRTPDVSHARGCFDAIARLNAVFRKTAKVDIAVYRQEYLNPGIESDGYELKDGNALGEQGYSYEYVSSALLDLPVCTVTNGMLDETGVGYKCLLIPERRKVSARCLQQVSRLLAQGLPVIWQGEKPTEPMYYSEVDTGEKSKQWQQMLDELWNNKDLIRISWITEASERLRKAGVVPRVEVVSNNEGGQAAVPLNMITAVRFDENTGRTYYILYRFNETINDGNPNQDSFGVTGLYRKGTAMPFYKRPGHKSAEKISVSLEKIGKTESGGLSKKEAGSVYVCNPWTGKVKPICTDDISIEEDQMIVLMTEGTGEQMVKKDKDLDKVQYLIPVFTSLKLYEFGPDSRDEASFLRSSFSVECDEFDLTKTGLIPWSELGDKYKYYAGKGIYTGKIYVPEIDEETEYRIRFAHVCDTFAVSINGTKTSFPDQDMKTVDLTGLLRKGENEIMVEVVSNLYNRVVGPQHDQPDFVFRALMPYNEKHYGIQPCQ